MSVGVIKDGQYVKCAPPARDYYIDSSDGAYRVYTAEGLLAWAAACENNITAQCHLMNDIDLDGVEWTPVGTSGRPYAGFFYGNGHVIKNLTQQIKQTDGLPAVAGFFGYIGNNGYVENLTFRDTYLQAGASGAIVYAGGVAAFNNGIIVNCTVQGQIEAYDAESSYVGGITGHSQGRLISRCINDALIVVNAAATAYGSGIAGVNYGLIEGCVNIEAISMDGDSTATAYGGGIVGSNTSSGVISGCSNIGSVFCGELVPSTEIYGAIAGRNNGVIQYCTNTNSSLNEVGE